jgi:hypothetical protein
MFFGDAICSGHGFTVLLLYQDRYYSSTNDVHQVLKNIRMYCSTVQ